MKELNLWFVVRGRYDVIKDVTPYYGGQNIFDCLLPVLRHNELERISTTNKNLATAFHHDDARFYDKSRQMSGGESKRSGRQETHPNNTGSRPQKSLRRKAKFALALSNMSKLARLPSKRGPCWFKSPHKRGRGRI